MRSRQTLPALALMIFSLLWSAGLALRPRPGEPVAAFFPPWFSSEQAYLAASSAGSSGIWGNGGWHWVVVAISDEPEFPDRLRQAGAVMIIGVPGIKGCIW